MDKKLKWHKIADTEDQLNFAENNLLQIEVAGKNICIAKAGNLYACAARCPHASGIIAEGFYFNPHITFIIFAE